MDLAKLQARERGTKMPRIFLNTLEASQKTLARLIRARSTGGVDSQTFKDLVYGLQTYLSFAKAQNQAELLERVAEIEKKLNL